MDADYMDSLKKVCNVVANSINSSPALYGIHLEGPCISLAYKGAQNEAYIRDCNIDEINELYAGYKALQKAGMDITKEAYQDKLDLVMGQLNGDLSNFNVVIGDAFRDVLSTAEDFDFLLLGSSLFCR